MIRAILINSTDLLGHHGCLLVNRQIEALAKSVQIQLVSRLPLHSDWDTLAPDEFDCVIVNGEGTLHSNSRGAKKIATVAHWAKQRGVPAFLINSLYQNNCQQITEQVGRFNRLWVRDLHSQHILQSEGVNAGYVPDLTLSWRAPLKPSSKQGIIVQDSTVRGTREGLFLLSRRIGGKYTPLIARPVSTQSGHNFSRRLKFEARRQLFWMMRSDEMRNAYKNAIPDFETFVDDLRKASLIVSGRFHGITLALKLRIPFIAIPSNSHKIEALLESVGMRQRLAPNIDAAEKKLKRPQTIAFSRDELKAIDEICAIASTGAAKMFADIAAEVRAKREYATCWSAAT